LVGRLSGFRAQTGSVAYWRIATFVRRLGEAAAPGAGECGPCPDFATNTLAFAIKLRKIAENLSQAFGRSAPYAIRLVDLPIAEDGLDRTAFPCRPWLSLQGTDQLSVNVDISRVAVLGGSPHQLTLSKTSRSVL